MEETYRGLAKAAGRHVGIRAERGRPLRPDLVQ